MYLIILSTLVFTKFKIFKYLKFCYVLLWNVLELPYLILKYFNLTTLMWYLLRKSQRYTPWVVYQYVNNNLCNGFLGFCSPAGHVNVAINKLGLLKLFKRRNKFHCTCFSLFHRKVVWAPVGLLFKKSCNLTIYYIWNI